MSWPRRSWWPGGASTRSPATPAEGSSRAWLFGIARHVLANQRRGVRRRHALADRLRSALRDQVVEPPDATMRAPIATALAGLGAADQELLRLVAWEGLSRGELATALGCSPAAVRVRLHRARTRLRRALADLDTAANGQRRPAAPAAATRRPRDTLNLEEAR